MGLAAAILDVLVALDDVVSVALVDLDDTLDDMEDALVGMADQPWMIDAKPALMGVQYN